MISPAHADRSLLHGSDAWTSTGLSAFRGITVGPIESSQQLGRGYGTPYSAHLLDELKRMGVNWISLTPFARIWSLKSTEILMDFEAPYEQNRQAIGEMIGQAHARGIRVLIIPHLWVESGGWRGEINPGSDEKWARYHKNYKRFILAWAATAAAAGADAFSVGVECASWSGRFGPVWEDLIGEIRKVFPGLLSYSANWDEADSVLFWDALDLIGIQAFYPLADHDDATDAEYIAGAQRVREQAKLLGEIMEKPVLFIEVGYTTRANAAVQPWLWPDDMVDVRVDEKEQARALSAVFDAFLQERWLTGFFLWRYYANLDDVSQEALWGFSPHGKLAQALLERTFHVRWASDPDAWPWLRVPPAFRFVVERLPEPISPLIGLHANL